MHDRDSLLDLDPDLARDVLGERLERARRDLTVRLGVIERGAWQPRPDAFGVAGGIGLLVTGGFMVRHVTLAHRAAAELLGPGDLLRPWQDDGEHAVYPFDAGWRVITRLSVAVIDRRIAGRLGPYPEITSELVGRAMVRSRRMAEHLVLAQLASVQHRVLLALWHLADEWGRVRPDGIVVPIPLTHELLGLVVGARRPSVTAALHQLEAAGQAFAQPGGGFRLTGEPPADLPLRRGHPLGAARSPAA